MSESLYELDVHDLGAAESQPVGTPPCPVCGHQRARARFGIEQLEARVIQCDQCRLGTLWPQPSAQEIRDFYPPDYYGDSGNKFEPLIETIVRWSAARHARSLASGLSPGAQVLDVGCGRGVLLSAFADAGHHVSGFEVSTAATEGADPRAEIRIGGCLRDAGYESETFDLVVLWHVLEHVSNPKSTLQEISRILKPGGRLVVAVPNFSSWQARWARAAWFHLDLPRHLFHFPAPALRKLISECGLDCVRESHFSLRQNPFGWIQSAMNKTGVWPRNALYVLLHQRGESNRVPMAVSTRVGLRICCLVAVPVAILLSLLAALARRGGTVSITARRPH